VEEMPRGGEPVGERRKNLYSRRKAAFREKRGTYAKLGKKEKKKGGHPQRIVN